MEEARKQVEKMTIEQACNVIAQYHTCDKCRYWNGSNYCNQNEDGVTNPKWYCADWQPRTEDAT